MTEVVDAWQAALGAEQQAAFGYAVLGPNLPHKRQSLARSCQAAHEKLRDATADAIAATGVSAQAPAGDYPALYPAARHPVALAAKLEDECAAAWRFLYAQVATAGAAASLRAQAQAGLTASAVRAARWRMLIDPVHAARPFPGT